MWESVEISALGLGYLLVVHALLIAGRKGFYIFVEDNELSRRLRGIYFAVEQVFFNNYINLILLFNVDLHFQLMLSEQSLTFDSCGFILLLIEIAVVDYE